MNFNIFHIIDVIQNFMHTALTVAPFIVILLIVLTTMYCFIVKSDSVSAKLKILIPLVAIIAIFFHFLWIGDLAGTPINGRPTGEFIYEHHKVISEHVVELWVMDMHGKSKLYRFNIGRNNQQELNRMKGRKEEGALVIGKFEKGDKARKGRRGNDIDDFILRAVPTPNPLPPKEVPPMVNHQIPTGFPSSPTLPNGQ